MYKRQGKDASAIRGAVEEVLRASFNVSAGDARKARADGRQAPRRLGDISIFVGERHANTKAWNQGKDASVSAAAVLSELLQARGIPAVPSLRPGNVEQYGTTGTLSRENIRDAGAGARRLISINLLEEPGLANGGATRWRITATMRIHDLEAGRPTYGDEFVGLVPCAKPALGTPGCAAGVRTEILTVLVDRLARQLKVEQQTPQ